MTNKRELEGEESFPGFRVIPAPRATIISFFVELMRRLLFLPSKLIPHYFYLHLCFWPRHLSQHGAPPQNRPRAERLPALRTAVLSLLVLLVPAVLDAASAVTVSTGDGDRLLQQVQTHRAAELVLVQRDAGHLGVCGDSGWRRKGSRKQRFKFRFSSGGEAGPVRFTVKYD